MPNTNRTEITVESGRAGVSPIATVSPNTGASAATNSTYAQGAFASGINEQAATSYVVQNSDYQGVILFNSASNIAVTLNSAVQQNFTCQILNLGTGKIILTPSATPSVYPVNGGSSLTLSAGAGVSLYFANRQWWAFSAPQSIVIYVNGTGIVDPNLNDATPAAGAGYENVKWQASGANVSAEVPIATTSKLGLTQPDGVTIGVTAGVIATLGFSGTVALAPLTSLGTPGTLTVANGLITGYVAPT